MRQPTGLAAHREQQMAMWLCSRVEDVFRLKNIWLEGKTMRFLIFKRIEFFILPVHAGWLLVIGGSGGCGVAGRQTVLLPGL